jgi:hypothetical protein
MERGEASILGLKRYITGRPCKNGHNAERFVSDGQCTECNRVRGRKENKDEASIRIKNLSEQIRRLERTEAEQHAAREYHKQWKKENRHKDVEWNQRRYVQKVGATPAWADLKAIQAIYKRAQELTERTGIPHHVDHEIPLRGKLVCGLHVETNLRVITADENVKKNNKFLPDVN